MDGPRQSASCLHLSQLHIKARKSVKLHSGKGGDTSSNLYWDRGWYVWNNDGDKAILRTSSGTLKDTCTWGDGIGYKNC